MIPLRDDIPTRRFPFVTASLIVVNVAVYLYQLTLNGSQYSSMVFKWGFIPLEYTHFAQVYPQLAVPYGLTVFTSMFVHGGFMHLAGNMLYLWIFGSNIEDFLGKIKFIIFYLVSGMAAVALFTITSPASEVPLVGASGTIAGVLGAYVALYPRARILAACVSWFLHPDRAGAGGDSARFLVCVAVALWSAFVTGRNARGWDCLVRPCRRICVWVFLFQTNPQER
jgi:membrane associated rhomboid family serine protease